MKRGWLLCALLLLAALFALALPNWLDGMRYPVRYEAEIRLEASRYGLPPALIAAIVNTESGYNPRARSPAGALGLMQIMPDTARWIAKKLGEGETDMDTALLSAKTCLRYGCWYVNFLLDRYKGDAVCAVAAYHAGQGTVDKWLTDARYTNGTATLSAFPDDAPQTRHYVTKVRNAYEYYLEAYE